MSYEVDFEDDDPNNFRDFTVEINDRFGLVESDSTDQDAQASFIVPEDPGTFEVSAEVEPNNGATYTVTVEECSSSQGGTPPAGETPREGTPPGDDPHEGTSPVQDQYAKKAPPGDVSNPKDVVPGSDVGKKIPVTGGPPLVLGALVLLGAALIAGRGVLRR